MDLRDLSERIAPALITAGWTQQQFREEVSLTAGRVIVRGKLAYRLQSGDVKGGPKRLHGIEVPSMIEHRNTLGQPRTGWTKRDRADYVISKPPFGSAEENSVLGNRVDRNNETGILQNGHGRLRA